MRSPGRVYLQRPRAIDGTEFLALLASSAEFHAPWFPERDAAAFEPAAFAAFLETDTGDRCIRFLIRRVEDDAILGAVNLNEIVRGAFQSAYLGYWIGVAYQGRGYMKEAVAQAVERAFGEFGLHRVEANIIPENTSSLGVVKALGFRREGYSPAYLKIAGEWRDHERWATFLESR